jgi:hypothetical protein
LRSDGSTRISTLSAAIRPRLPSWAKGPSSLWPLPSTPLTLSFVLSLHSAGAISVSLQLLAYGKTSTDLFRAGILESGSPPTWNYRTPADLQPQFDAVASAVGCANTTDVLACLRAAPVETFTNATNGTSWGPVVDGTFIKGSVTAALKAGQFTKVPLLIGGERRRVPRMRENAERVCGACSKLG